MINARILLVAHSLSCPVFVVVVAYISLEGYSCHVIVSCVGFVLSIEDER